MGIKDSLELARQDWFGNAGFDRDEDAWPRRWAEAYLQFAHEEKRAWLREKGVGFFPVVGWAERGGYTATGPGNSVPRFHITWGTGPGIVAPFQAAVEEGEARGLRHDPRPPPGHAPSLTADGAVTGAAGDILAPSGAARGMATSREVVGAFEITAGATIVSSGRHRRQPRPRPQAVARAAGHAAGVDGHRRAGVRRRRRCSRSPSRPARG